MPREDEVRIAEFYRLGAEIEDRIWPGWSKAPAPLLLVTAETEFLTHLPAPPKGFQPTANGLFARPRQFPPNLLATFPAFGPPSVIVVGEPAQTEAKTSTPWVITLLHERFHQLQETEPDLYRKIDQLGLSRGDTSGMWMLEYPFPYARPEVAQGFARLRDALLAAVEERSGRRRAIAYARARAKFFAALAPDDRKYFEFQLWKEGVARYTQIRAAEEAAAHEPSADFRALPDYEPFAELARKARSDTLRELRGVELSTWKRVSVYSFGAAEAMLLDRVWPQWKKLYFQQPLSMAPLFAKLR